MKFLLVGDMHLRDDQPDCRTDDFREVQRRKLEWLGHLRLENSPCTVLCAGDVFHKWRTDDHWLTGWALEHLWLIRNMYCAPGNHDLPYHRMADIDRSAFWVMLQGGVINQYCGTSYAKQMGNHCAIEIYGYGETEPCQKTEEPYPTIQIHHRMVFQKGKPPFPGCKGITSKELLEQNPHAQLILTGDNHQQFVTLVNGRTLINPGSLTRQTSDQRDFVPAVYLVEFLPSTTRTLKWEHIPVPIEKDVFKEPKETPKAEGSAFVEYLQGNTAHLRRLNFREQMERFLDANPVKKEVRELIMEALDHG